MTNEDVLALIEQDPWMMDILKKVQQLQLPDWWIGAGFVRSKVWDHLHGYTINTPLPDIDVIYFDNNDSSIDHIKQEEKTYEALLKKQLPEINWSVTNQARMHLFHNDAPYKTSEEALSHWVETATCVGVRLTENSTLLLTAPHGISDLVHLQLSPTKGTDIKTFYTRIEKKEWLKKWPKLQINIPGSSR
jgi:hypothetical protein